MKDNENQPITNPSDHLANERTFLAWIRTSVAIMGFGFVVVKFALFIKQISFAITDKQAILPKGHSNEIGILLVVLGAFITLYAYVRYSITEKQLINKVYKPSSVPALILTLAIVIIGVLLAVYLIPGL
jgi:putative membrane protein